MYESSPQNLPVNVHTLTEEQQVRKRWLLSRFRNFDQTAYPQWFHAQPHDEMDDELEMARPDIGIGTTQKKVLYLAPRYTYKTSKVKAFMIFLILWFREYGIDIAMQYVRSKAEAAEEVLFELKQDMQSNETILEYWGDLSVDAQLWSQKKINLGQRRDPTISTAGLDYGAAGKHIDIVFLDDIVDEKNYDSIKAKRAGKVKVQSYYPVLPPWGSMVVSGTRYAHNDVYGWLLDTNAKDRRAFENFLAHGQFEEAEKVRPQWREYIRRVRDRAGHLFFPERLTEAFLAQQKRSMEAKFYAAWYENSPDVEGMVRFRPEYLQYFSAQYAWTPIPMLTLIRDGADGKPYALATFPVRVTMTVDPTLTANQTSDTVGITVNATDADGGWWVLVARRYLEVPSVVGERIIELVRIYRPAVLRIESANADVGMVARIQQVISAENIPTVITSYSVLQDEDAGGVGRPSRRKKNARIEALEPHFRNMMVHLHRDTCEALYDQYINWPDVDTDDVFDALAMQFGLAKPCRFRTLADAQRVDIEREDEEPGRSGVLHYTLYDRQGNPVLVSANYEGESSDARLLGRAGLGSTQLRVR